MYISASFFSWLLYDKPPCDRTPSLWKGENYWLIRKYIGHSGEDWAVLLYKDGDYKGMFSVTEILDSPMPPWPPRMELHLEEDGRLMIQEFGRKTRNYYFNPLGVINDDNQ